MFGYAPPEAIGRSIRMIIPADRLSNRPTLGTPVDLWTSTRKTPFDAWSTPVNLGGTVNSEFDDQHPTVSSDGQTLFFASNRTGGVGGFDLYMTTRMRLQGQ